ncbi:hypothetical protein AVEN_131515-1 [Araneus ventricosus]|uniref:Uncharacterized protein n=1 Tax=Araneus ventricosus TaxID=182803 RepID=A0A4Y2KHD5_ARAVE|nr:hypothetical protein AVEN_131515-1 [Araneus ventricosus]
MLEEWQTSWNNGDTGRKIYDIMPSVSLRPTNWLERMLSSALSVALSLPTSQGVTSPTAIKLWWNWHGTSLCHGVCPRRVQEYEEASAKLRTRMAEKESPITPSPGIKLVG